ncbi:type III polyketide synthase [Streptomyces sp. NBC_01304]|uniref:type III polyketide synthase n=1 Tax=Streptomyces sp. NBC_01304 TaxID=2903818 RepID=UPI002E1060E0|nr:type III polyketide synthase [Streptomyces sp. NBC_01304]
MTGAVLCRPAVWLPPHTISREQTLALADVMHADHPQHALAARLIGNTGVRKRHLIRPLYQTLRHDGVEERTRVFTETAKTQLPQLVTDALASAGVGADEVSAIVFVSCTGFTMPPLTAWMINNLGFRPDTTQIPIAQLGCAAGGAAINRAHDYANAHPGSHVLVVAVEFCSLVYQPSDIDVGSLLSDGLFGDAMAACVVRGDGNGRGMRLVRGAAHLVPDTEDWISYKVKDTGWHFQLDKRVPGTMSMLAPMLHTLAQAEQWDATKLDYYVIHAGGPRILDDLCFHLNVDPEAFANSRATLESCGNIASCVVLATAARLFDDPPADGARGLLAGFGPGITAEASLSLWQDA